MSRRRELSTEISTDPRLADLAQYGALPLLLYTWAIPHADDWGRLSGDARQFQLTVCPALAVTTQEVDQALDQVAEVGLWERYTIGGKSCIAFPQDAWYKHQSYIPATKRQNDRSQFPPPPPGRTSPQNAAERRTSPQNPASPSPSLAPTPEVISQESVSSGERESAVNDHSCSATTSAPSVRAARPRRAMAEAYDEEFDRFWAVYPRRIEKRRAYAAWRTRVREGTGPGDLLAAATHYAADCRLRGTEERFIKHPATFLGPAKPFEDWIRPRAAPGPAEPKAWAVLREFQADEEVAATHDQGGDRQGARVRDGPVPAY